LAAIYHNNCGLANYNCNNPKEAINHFKQAKKINAEREVPFEDPTISFNLANVYLSQKNFLEARDAYEEAIKLQNMNPKYWHHKGLVYEAMI
jgi:tetratricopeptide (TPR) repeat protein